MVLREGLEICDGKRKLPVYESSDANSVGIDVDVGDGTVITIVAVLCDEATPLISFLVDSRSAFVAHVPLHQLLELWLPI